MKNLAELKAAIPDYCKDIRTNIDRFISEKNKVLEAKYVFGVALTSAYTTKDKTLIKVLEKEAKNYLSDSEISLTKMATSMMAMNNSYYCFTHVSADKEYLEMPSTLVMSSIKNLKANRTDFEVFALSASIINSCSICIDSHEIRLYNDGFSREKIQMIAQIASIVASIAQVFAIENI